MNNVTRQELQQYFYLNREIKFMEDELKEINRKFKKTNPKSVTELDRIALRGNILQGKINRFRQNRNKVENFVNSIQDSLTRQIFYYRYIKFMTWRKVSSMVGGYLSEDGVRSVVRRYLEKIEKNGIN